MDRAQIIVKVKLRLDELGPFEEGQVIDTGRIDHFLDDCVSRLLMIVPPYIPTPSDFTDDNGTPVTAVEHLDDKSGYIPLPDDFVRFVSLRMHSWHRTVTRAITENDPNYAMQGNEFLRGSNDKPVVVYRFEPDAVTATAPYTQGKVLEYFSVTKGDHVITRGLYLKATVAELLDENLVDPLTWLVAATMLDTVSEFEAAKAANAKVTDWINMRTVI